jgi:DNA mismatch repair protein MutS
MLVDRAAHLLEIMEKKQEHVYGDQLNRDEGGSNVQLSIFDAHTEVFDEIRRMLNGINIDQLTPLEALVILNEIRKKVK